jgi:hypothetical protein
MPGADTDKAMVCRNDQFMPARLKKEKPDVEPHV